MMECRVGCGACCIAPSITTPIPGMPMGKPAGERCVQLDDANRCMLFGDPLRPEVCASFKAELEICGHSQTEALATLAEIELRTL